MQIHGPGILQKWISGRLLGSSFLSNGKEVALHRELAEESFTRVGDRPFIYNGSSPYFSRGSVQQILSIGSKLVKETGYRGVFNLDWIMGTSSQPFLIEVNARWSGSLELVERSWSSQLLHAKVEVPFKSVMDWAVEAIAGLRHLLFLREFNAHPMMAICRRLPAHLCRSQSMVFRFNRVWLILYPRLLHQTNRFCPTGSVI